MPVFCSTYLPLDNVALADEEWGNKIIKDTKIIVLSWNVLQRSEKYTGRMVPGRAMSDRSCSLT